MQMISDVSLRMVRADWLRVESEVAWVRMLFAARAFKQALERQRKFNPYHDDDGMFTTADNAVPPKGGRPVDREGARVAQATRPRSSFSISVGAQTFEATPSQVQALSNARSLADARMARVREIDPNWKPAASLNAVRDASEAIRDTLAIAAEAEARLIQLARQGIGGNGGPPMNATAPSAGTGTAAGLGSRGPRLPVAPSAGLPEFLMREPGRGSLSGNLSDIEPDERAFAEEMRDLGNHVRVIPRGVDRTPDYDINGTLYERKRVSGVAKQDSDGISAAITNRSINARAQAQHIIIDAREQPGMTRAIAERSVKRVYGKDSDEGSKIQSLTILTPDGPVYSPRRK